MTTTVFAANGRSAFVSSRMSQLRNLSCPFSLNSRCLRIVIRRQGERIVMMLAEEDEDDTEPIDSSTAVAEIGGTKYASLPEAFAAASNYDDTITLLNNTELAEPLSVSLNDHYISHFTLDLNGKTISCNNGNSDTIFVCATLIICDSSSEKLEGSQKTLILPTGAGRAKNRFPAQLCSHSGNG